METEHGHTHTNFWYGFFFFNHAGIFALSVFANVTYLFASKHERERYFVEYDLLQLQTVTEIFGVDRGTAIRWKRMMTTPPSRESSFQRSAKAHFCNISSDSNLL